MSTTTTHPAQRAHNNMPASTKDSSAPSPMPTHSATPSGPSTPLPGRISSKPSTRRSTPVNTPGAALAAAPTQPSPLNTGADDGDSYIPPPPHGKPSYKEYDEKATPSLVTASMHTLGDMPTAKMLEATKRPYPYQSKKKTKGKAAANGNAAPGGAGRPGQAGQAKTATPSATAPTTPDASVRASGSPSAPASHVTTPKPTAPNPWINGNAPSSKTSEGRKRLSLVVEAAVHRSKITGNTDMGRAIKKLYQESLANDDLAELLDAVLAQKATPEQFQHFQTIARQAREAPDTEDIDLPISLPKESGEEVKEGAEVNQAESSSQTVNGKTANGVVTTSSGMNGDLAKAEAAAAQSASATPAPEEPVHPSKRTKLPTYEELKQDSNIRGTPRPAPLAMRRGKKRARSPSPAPSMNEPSPAAPVVAEKTPQPPQSAVQTPTLVQQHPKKKSKTNKIKVSPVKKAAAVDNTVVTAGIGEAPDHRRARYGSEEVSENDDVCASCSGAGRFLCCERCPRSFHFTCLDPPLEEVPEGMWFCNMCQAQMNPPAKEQKGLFAQLFDNIHRRNVAAFKLPTGIRNYFVGVETGVLGEYVDTRDAKTQKYSKSGFAEEYDTRKLKDKNGTPILCHDCGKSAVNGQQIISCDYCPLHWHLDCIRPLPMSIPPSGKRKWMCPAHVDWALERRRPKNAPVVDTHLRRGHKNNGLIEVENEEESEFEEVTISGVVYRLPERGIKLDFLDKVKQMNARENSRKRAAEANISEESPKRLRVSDGTAQKTSVTQTPDAQVPMDLDSRDEQLVSALLELKSQARVNAELQAKASIPTFLEGLLKEADPADVALLTKPGAPASAKSEIQQLLTFHDLIAKRLVALQTAAPSPAFQPASAAPQPKPVENGHTDHAELPSDHQMDDKEFNDLMDAEMDGAFEVDQEQAAPSSSQSAPVAPMAPMMPVNMAPVAPMAPMAFMKPSK